MLLAMALGACQDTSMSRNNPNRGNVPLSQAVVEELGNRGMTRTSPVLIRIFKEEAELEVWKRDRGGRFALFKVYPICNYSGELGPKVREGDRQSPEGFYQVNMGLMNPRSSYYLAFNMGFPNQFDRSYGRTGSHLMVHGDCSSRGCYAMTDEAIAEVYALARDALQGGQESFQVQAFPFRMTPRNMARHRNSPHMAFWRNLKEGYDHFEVTRHEPQVDVCERRYVFNAVAPNSALAQAGGSSTREMIAPDPWAGTRNTRGTSRANVTTTAAPRTPVPVSLNQPVTTVAPVTRAAPAEPSRSMRQRFTAISGDTSAERPPFQAAGRCPAFVVPPAIREAVAAKQARDNVMIASLSRQITAAPARTGIDGGTHRSFAGRFTDRRIRVGSTESESTLAAASSTPVTLEAASGQAPASVAAAAPAATAPAATAAAPQNETVATRSPAGTSAQAPTLSAFAPVEPAPAAEPRSGNWFTRLMGRDQPAAIQPASTAPAVAAPTPQPRPQAAAASRNRSN
ncbi:L,D-transpeptidase family protein [Phreatobacter sp.]|uniref:L,D-transpeptidase family protein n=1 Tax=Phreatobacter sp. TaxID=1966341 RepID=UPI003F72C00F